jgi:hypothetical protein
VSNVTSTSCICGGGAKVIAPRGSQRGARDDGGTLSGDGAGAVIGRLAATLVGTNEAPMPDVNDASAAWAAAGATSHVSHAIRKVASVTRARDPAPATKLFLDRPDRISRVVWLWRPLERKQSRFTRAQASCLVSS